MKKKKRNNYLKKKNMNNEKVKTKIETKTRTRLITGVILAVIAAIGIGTAIWYFGIAPNLDQPFTFDDTFGDLDYVETKNDFKYGADEKRLEFYNNEKVFQNDLEKIGFICPAEIKDRVSRVQIFAGNPPLQIDSADVLDRENNNLFPESLKEIVKISVFDVNGVRLNDDLVSEYILSSSISTWGDLIRWKTDPKFLIVFSNGSVLPVNRGAVGTTKIQAAICGVLSNELEVQIDPENNQVGSFNNIAKSRMGDQFPFYEQPLTNAVILSKEIPIATGDKYVKQIKLTLKPKVVTWQPEIEKIIPGRIRPFAILDNGKKWVEIPDKNNLFGSEQKINDDGTLVFEEESLPQYQGNIKYALLFQYNRFSGKLHNRELRDFEAMGIPPSTPKILHGGDFLELLIPNVQTESGGMRMFLIAFNHAGYSLQAVPPELEAAQPDVPPVNSYQDEAFYNANLLNLSTIEGVTTAAISPGLAYYQAIKITKLRDTGEEVRRNVAQGIALTMPAGLTIEDVGLELKAGERSCLEGQELIDGECTTPLPPEELIVNIKANPESCDAAPCEIQFDAEVSKGEGPYMYGWRFGDRPIDPLPDSIETNPKYTYKNPGVYKVFLVVLDKSKNTGTSYKTISVGATECQPGEVLIDGVCQKAGDEENEPDLMLEQNYVYRNANRVILTWKVGKDELKNKDLTLKYGTYDPKDIKKDAEGNVVLEEENTVNAHYDKDKDYYYAVLDNLKGGEFSDKNDAGFTSGRKPYIFQVSLGDKHAKAADLKTLNRFQTILYYYNLVLGDTFDLEQYEQPDKSLRAGGPDFFYKPEGQEPLSLKGVQFTLLNDRKFEEFNKRIQASAKKYGNKKAIEMLYRKVHDRIYDDDLEKFSDPAGVTYWTKQVERDDDDRIDLLGAKFAISVSKEAVGDISAMPANEQKKAKADLAYEIVLKRGGDQKGIENLMTLANAKEMRQKLAMSGEYDDRLKSIKGRRVQIEELYETLYARAADVAGVDYWDNSGKSIQDIKKEFLNSAEFTKVAQ